MKHEIVINTVEWHALREEWNELLEHSRSNTLFLTWEWLDSWMRVQPFPPELLVICVRDERGQLVGLAPYYRTEYRLVRILRYRVLHILGDTEGGAEYQTWIARESCEKAAFTEIVRALNALRPEWDLIWMPRLETWVGTAESVVDVMREGGLAVNSRKNDFSAVELPASFDTYLSRMSANRRQQTRKFLRTALRNPGVEIRRVTSETELGPALETLFELNGKRWKLVGDDGAFANHPIKKAFYKEFAPRALSNGWLAMYVLYDDGDPKAVQLGYVYHGSFLQIQEGFDPDYLRGIGNALRAKVIEDCIDSGVNVYDFLGGTSEHKRRWLAEERPGLDVLAARPCLKNTPILTAGIWPPGAYLQRQDPGKESSMGDPLDGF